MVNVVLLAEIIFTINKYVSVTRVRIYAQGIRI